jgi:Cu/Ag efflux protein CusF
MAQRGGVQLVSEGAAALPWTSAEVRRIDKAARKVALKHGEIKTWTCRP